MLQSKVPRTVRDLVSTDNKSRNGVSIVGMSCRFPGGVESPSMFWDLMKNGACTSSKVPFSRWDVNVEVARNKAIGVSVARCIQWGSFVQDLDLFDAGFFGISAAEASTMDPQQRLLLECTYLALVDAGNTKESVQGRNIGVFVGILNSYSSKDINPLSSHAVKGAYAANGTDHATAAGRISFVFGLQGPCSVYSTACSSS